MKKLMQWALAHPVLSVLLVLLGTLTAIPGLFKIVWDPSVKGMIVRGNEAHRYYTESVALFGTDDVSSIFVSDRNLFTPEKLRTLARMIHALAEIDGVARTESMFSFLLVEPDGEGGLQPVPDMGWIPDTREDALAIRHGAIHNPILVNNLISADGNTVVVNIYWTPALANQGLEVYCATRIDKVLEDYAGAFQELFQFGLPDLNRALSRSIVRDLTGMVPVSVAVLLLVLGLCMRSAQGVLLPFASAALSVTWTLGFMGYAGIPINILTAIVIPLLFAVGSTEEVHIISEFRQASAQGKARRSAVEEVIEKTGTAVTLTALTTFLGFLATTTNQISLLRQFGFAASFGLLANPVITALLTPPFLGILTRRNEKPGPVRECGRSERLFSALGARIVSLCNRRKKTLLVIWFGSTILAVLFTFEVSEDNNPLGYFRPSADIVKRSHIVGERLSGSQTFQVRISGGSGGTFLQPEKIRQIWKLQKYLRECGVFATSVSIADFIAYLHMMSHDGNPEFFSIPEEEETIAEYMRYLVPQWPTRHMNRDLSQASITVFHNIRSGPGLQEAMKSLDQFISEEMDPHLIVRTTGRSVLVNQAATTMTIGQIESISIILAAILVIMSFLFYSFRAGLLSLIPNIVPIALLFGTMGLFGIPLNVGTAMVAAISIGIAVDNTIHMMYRYSREVRRLNSVDLAIEACIRKEIRPVVVSTVGLTLGFATLSLSAFSPVAWFGLLSALVMVFAGAADLLLTPVLLSKIQVITLWDIFRISLRKEVLEDVELFLDMKPGQIRKFVLMGKLNEANPGDLIMKQGDRGDDMLLVLEGQARVFVTEAATGRETVLSAATPGMVVGEMALMTGVTRTASIVAETPMTYITYDRTTIERVKQHAPKIASQLFLNLSSIMVHRLQEQARTLTLPPAERG